MAYNVLKIALPKGDKYCRFCSKAISIVDLLLEENDDTKTVRHGIIESRPRDQ